LATIVLTGGGTAGHVTPHLALLPALREAGYDVHYIGTRTGIERGLIEPAGVPYYDVPAGKLRRYVDWRNFTDVFRIGLGFLKAFFVLGRIKPDIVFSKGGFVTPPVIWAAWLRRIPVVCHESDMTPGLANKLALPFARRICHAFSETGQYLPTDKAVHTGIPVRSELRIGDAEKGQALCGFSADRPVLLIIGGSQGSQAINAAVRSVLPELLEDVQVCHLCGKGGLVDTLKETAGYAQFEYVTDELPDLFAAADCVISRAGATTLFELLALNKPTLLIPLSARASRGDQILNAASFEQVGYSLVLSEEDLTPDTLLQSLRDLQDKRNDLEAAMQSWANRDAVADVIEVIYALTPRSSLPQAGHNE